MPSQRQYRVAEQELMESLASVPRKTGDFHNLCDCPSMADLRLFVAGKCDQARRNELLEHMGSCDRCITLLRQMRQRALLIRKTSLVLAAAAVLMFAIWATLGRTASKSSTIATIDLRLISPTRGIDGNHGAITTKAQRKAGRLRIILPIGGEGKYECQILRQGQRVPTLFSSGEARLENHDVVLDLAVELSGLPPGHYSLALRRESSEWAYYPLLVE